MQAERWQKLERILSKYRQELKLRGLESDAINQPSARKGSLACSPDDLVLGRLLSSDETTTSMLLEASYLAGDASVASKVHASIDYWLAAPIADVAATKDIKIRTRRELLNSKAVTLGEWLRNKVNGWKFDVRMEHAIHEVKRGVDEVNIKQMLYRPLQNVLFMETLGAPIDGRGETPFNALSKLRWLERTGKWSHELVEQAHEALSMIVKLRMLAHGHAGKEQDTYCLACRNELFDGYHVPQHLLPSVERAARIVGCIAGRYNDHGRVSARACTFPP